MSEAYLHLDLLYVFVNTLIPVCPSIAVVTMLTNDDFVIILQHRESSTIKRSSSAKRKQKSDQKALGTIKHNKINVTTNAINYDETYPCKLRVLLPGL